MQRFPAIALGLGLGLACAAIVCTACQHGPAQHAAQAATPESTAPAAPRPASAPVATGAAFKWRTLATLPAPAASSNGSSSVPGVIIGRFVKGTHDQQALLLRSDGSTLLGADLSAKPLPLRAATFIAGDVLPWDYDRDGADELVCSPLLSPAIEDDNHIPDAKDGAAVLGLDGKLRGVVPCEMGSHTLVGDFNGDGFAELLVQPLPDIKPAPAPLYGKDGVRSGELKLDQRELANVVGDVDGDGVDELVAFNPQGSPSLVGYNLKLGRFAIGAWGKNGLDLPQTAWRLSSDKAQDIFSGYHFWNAKDHQLVTLPGYPGDLQAAAAPPLHAVVQASAGSPRWLATVTMDTAGQQPPTQLVFYDVGARQVHRETLTGEIQLIDTLEAGGMAHLIVQLKDKLLIYP